MILEKKYCDELKDIMDNELLVDFRDFNFVFDEIRESGDLTQRKVFEIDIHMTHFKKVKTGARALLNEAFRLTSNGIVFKVYGNNTFDRLFRANLKTFRKIGQNVVKINDKVYLEEKNKVIEFTILGFEVGTDNIIASYVIPGQAEPIYTIIPDTNYMIRVRKPDYL